MLATMLTTVLGRIGDLACVFDKGGEVLFANQPLLDLLGSGKVQQQEQQVFDTRESVSGETFVLSPAFADEGSVDVVVGIAHAQNALRHSEELLRLITNLVPHGIFAKDAAGRHIFVNRALAEMSNLSAAEMLGKDDFDLAEDGRPQKILYFSRDTDLPLTLGLLVDTSLSQRDVLSDERRSSYRFLETVLREDRDHAFVIHFDREVELLQDLTASRDKLERALDQLELPQRQQRGGYPGQGGGSAPGQGGGGYPRRGQGGPGTTLYDAILLASDDLMKKQQGRKAIILLTDGVDNGSKVPLSEAIEAAQRADTLVYSILFAGEEGYGQPFGMGVPGMGRRGGMGRYPSS